jgi:hypothetical protein
MEESTFYTVMARFEALKNDAYGRRAAYEGQAHYDSMSALLRHRVAVRVEEAAFAAVAAWVPDDKIDWHVQFVERAALLAHAEACSESTKKAWAAYALASEVSDSYSEA